MNKNKKQTKEIYKLTNYDVEKAMDAKHFVLKNQKDFEKIEKLFNLKNFKSKIIDNFNIELKNNEFEEYKNDFDWYSIFGDGDILINSNIYCADLYFEEVEDYDLNIKYKKIEIYIKRIFLKYRNKHKTQIFSYIEKLTFVI